MSLFSARLLYWSPRIITLAFALFLGLFALESFQQAHGFWRLVGAFIMNSVPALLVIAVLAAAWKWEWIGTVVFTLLAVWYTHGAIHRHFLSWPITLSIPAPLIVVAALFLVDWIERDKLRAARSTRPA